MFLPDELIQVARPHPRGQRLGCAQVGRADRSEKVVGLLFTRSAHQSFLAGMVPLLIVPSAASRILRGKAVLDRMKRRRPFIGAVAWNRTPKAFALSKKLWMRCTTGPHDRPGGRSPAQNEGDIVVAAEKVTPDAINFMMRNACGLVCLAMSPAICDHLNLDPLPGHHLDASATPFTPYIDARTGITTGISAFDRARTVQVAIDERTTPADLVRGKGHVPGCAPGGRRSGSRRPHRRQRGPRQIGRT